MSHISLIFRHRIQWKRSHAPPLSRQFFTINLGDRIFSRKSFIFRQKGSVFRDQMMSPIHKICRRFTHRSVRVQIGAHGSRALVFHKISAVCCLPGQFVTRRRIGDDRRSRHRMITARRNRHPQILADFNRETKFRHLLTAE